MTEEQFKDECASILCNNITFSPQGQNYIITGVLEAIWKLHTEQKLNKHGVSGKQPDQKTIRAAAVNYSEKHREHDRWMKTRYYCFKDFQAGAQWALSTVAGVCSGSDKTT